MTTKEILSRMSKGAKLCMTFTGDPDHPKSYWLHPSRAVIRADQAEAIIKCPGVISGRDNLIEDAPAQTWRIGR